MTTATEPMKPGAIHMSDDMMMAAYALDADLAGMVVDLTGQLLNLREEVHRLVGHD
jgi:hypothetical protein